MAEIVLEIEKCNECPFVRTQPTETHDWFEDYAEDYLAFKIEGKFNNLSDNDYVGSIYNFNTSREEELFAIPEGMRQM